MVKTKTMACVSLKNDWVFYLNPIFTQYYFKNMLAILAKINSSKTICPPKKLWFKAFETTSFSNTKVIILGQDPYHIEGLACGLSFSIPKGKHLPYSLINIYQELKNDVGIVSLQDGDLSNWAKQGVLLLNSILTVEKKLAASHANIGWETFTDNVISILSAKKQNLVFIMWGAYAQKKARLIDKKKHLILKAAHPSPLSAYKGFFGCKHFSKANAYLHKTKQNIIKW